MVFDEPTDQEKLKQGLITLLTNLCQHEYGHVLITPMQNFDFVLKVLKAYEIKFSDFNLVEDISQENLTTKATGYRFNWQTVLPLPKLPKGNELGSLRRLATFLLYRKGQLKDVGDGRDVEALASTLICSGKPLSELAQEVDTAFQEFLQLNELVLDILHYFLVLRVLIKIGNFLILLLLPNQVPVHKDLLADYLLQFLIHLH